MTQNQSECIQYKRNVKFKTICNSCIVCHKETDNPNPFYICDKCAYRLKQKEVNADADSDCMD